MKNQNQGVTLIALVITIIVLLILAGVNMNVMFGDDDLLQKAQLAKERTNDSVRNEQESLDYIDNLLKNYTEDDYIEPFTPDDTWDGTSQEIIPEGDNYYIWTCEQLKWFEEQVNSSKTFENKNVYLMANLDMGARKVDGVWQSDYNWIPIGSASGCNFKGNFYGGNKTIGGLYVNSNKYYSIGLFSYNYGNVQDLKVRESYFNNKNTKYGSNYVGCIIGTSNQPINNCHSILNTIERTDGKALVAGGIMASATQKNSNCTSISVEIKHINNLGLNNSTIGGIVGISTNAIENCKTSGDMDIKLSGGNSGNTILGGIVGESSTTDIKDLENHIKIQYHSVLDGSSYVGGIVGKKRTGEIINCNNYGEITGNVNLAGIVGNYSGTLIEGCTNNGKLIIKELSKVTSGAGIAVSIDNANCIVKNCTNNGEILSNASYIYGISKAGKVSDCINNGNISFLNINNEPATYIGNLISISGITEGIESINCTNNGNITVEAERIIDISGIADSNTVQNCVNNGKIKCIGRSNVNVSGISRSAKEISNCKNYGEIDAKINALEGVTYQSVEIAGIISSSNNNIQKCNNYGKIIVSAEGVNNLHSSAIGGVRSKDRICNCYRLCQYGRNYFRMQQRRRNCRFSRK